VRLARVETRRGVNVTVECNITFSTARMQKG
jgi:hypothetical protein